MITSDLDLLQRYTRQRSEDAFAELVRRHLDLVYSAALRQVRSPQLAEEVAQSVFMDLSRNAAKLKQDSILTAWLYQVTRRTAVDVVRREARRQLREQTATEMNAMNATAADWTHIEPLLDEAMHALDDTDRAAVLLRYFENKSLRDVGANLGTSDDAAQKRVSRAVERLREFFSKRGVTVGASGLVVVISANAVQAAPVGLAATICTAAALAGTTVSTSTAIVATKTIAMTTLQKTVITAAIAAAVGTGIYEAHHASNLKREVQALHQQHAPLTTQVGQLRRERDDATSKLSALQQENDQLRRDTAELAKLRGEVARLRALRKEVSSLQKMANASVSGLAEWKLDQGMNAGRTTPQDALQSYLWAEMTTNSSELRQCLVADESDPPTEDDIDQFVDNPNNHLRLSKDQLKNNKIKVLSQKIVSPDEVVLTVFRQFDESGEGYSIPLTLRNVNGEWKLVVSNVRDAAGKVTRVRIQTKPLSR